MIGLGNSIGKLSIIAGLAAMALAAPFSAMASGKQRVSSVSQAKASGTPSTAGVKDLISSHGPLGSGFIENKGQWDPRAYFYSGSPGVDTWIIDSGVVYDFHRYVSTKSGPMREGHVVEMDFAGATTGASPAGGKQAGPTVNFLNGHTTFSGKSYATASIKNLYRGINLELSHENGSPRFDLVAAPGVDTGQIKIQYRGQDGMYQNPDGSLTLQTQEGEKEVADLHAYQQVQGTTEQVPCRFKLNEDGTVGFKVGAHDSTKSLTIDPVVYSTLLGDGGGAPTFGYGAYVGSDSAPVVTGSTEAGDFPTTLGAYNQIVKMASAFVSKFSDDATHLLYSTIINSNGVGIGMNVAVDPIGNIWVSGLANNEFGALQGSVPNGKYGQFLVKLSPGGTQLLLSDLIGGGFNLPGPLYNDGWVLGPIVNSIQTFIGVIGYDPKFYSEYLGMNLDNQGNCYLMGKGTITPTSNAYQKTNEGDGTYIESFNNNGVLQWGSYFTAPGTFTYGAFVAPDGSIYFCGGTNGGLVATKGAFDTEVRGGGDGFVTRFQAVASSSTPMKMSYTTYIGGSGTDTCDGITADSLGQAVVYGEDGSTNFPFTPNAYSTGSGYGGPFLAKFSLDGSTLQFATLTNCDEGMQTLDGSGYATPVITSIALDSIGNIYITGSCNPTIPFTGFTTTGNADYPKFNAFNFTEATTSTVWIGPSYTPGDATLAVMNPTGTGLVYASFFGGTYDEQGESIAIDSGANCYMVGWTDSYSCAAPASTEYPTTGGVFDSAYSDAFGTPTPPAPIFIPPMAFLTKVRATDASFLNGLAVPVVIAGVEGGTGSVSINAVSNSNTTISLQSSNPAVAAVPPTCTVVSGTQANTFGISAPDLTVITPVTITAYMDGVFINRTIEVSPWLSSFSVAVASIVGGNSTTARAYLSVPTPQANPVTPPQPYLTITVTSSDPSKAVAVDGNAGASNEFYVYTSTPGTPSDNITVPIQTFGVDDPTTVTFFAQITGGPGVSGPLAAVASAPLKILPASVTGIQFLPDVITGGNGSVGTVQLNGSVGPTPVTIGLAQTSGSAVLSLSTKSVTIGSQGTSATFNVTTQPVTFNTFGTVTASQTLNGTPVTANGTLYVQPVRLSSITAGTTTLVGGSTTPGYVTLATQAPNTGVTVNLSSNNPKFLNVSQSSVTVKAGQTSSPTFTITSVVTNAEEQGTITATDGAYASVVTITILPETMSLKASPSTVVGSQQSVIFTLSLGQKEDVPTVVNVSSNNTTALTLSASSVTVPANTSSVTFTGFTNVVNPAADVTVTASLPCEQGTITAKAVVTVNPLPLTLAVTPSTLIGGVQNGAGTVTLPSAAASATTVTLSSSNASIAAVSPSSVSIAAGGKTGSFTVTTGQVTAQTNVTIKGTDSNGSNTTVITILPPNVTLASLTANPSSGTGGFSSTGTLTVTGTTPKGGLTVSLTSSNAGAVQVPSSVTVAQGADTAQFPITTNPVTADTTVVITAKWVSQSVSTTMTIYAQRIGTLTISPSSVTGGGESKLTISLNVGAPPGGLTVPITWTPQYAGLSVVGLTNGSGFIPAGKTSASYTIMTPQVSRQLGATFTATFGSGGNQSSATLLINPAP